MRIETILLKQKKERANYVTFDCGNEFGEIIKTYILSFNLLNQLNLKFTIDLANETKTTIR